MIAYLAAVAAIILSASLLALKLINPRPLPPGPKPLPFVGNLHQHPPSEPWVKYQEWHQKFGEIITVQLGLRTAIVLGSHKAVQEILEKRGKVYCSRPRLVIGECISKSLMPVFSPYTPKWRDLHKLTVTVLTTRACKAYCRVQERESLRLAFTLLDHENHDNTMWQYAAGVLSTLAYGEQPTAEQAVEVDELRNMGTKFVNAFSYEGILLELYPFLNLLPSYLNGPKRAGRDFHRRVMELWPGRIQRGLRSKNWNWTQILFDNKPENTTWEQFVYLMVELELSSTISTTLFLNMFLAVVAQNPKAVEQVRNEVDRIVGSDRLPKFDDHDNLPLTLGLILELMRWKTVSPLSVPHSGLEEDEYSGYRIPTEAFIIANQWALNMDSSVYGDPESFRPERWVIDPELPKPTTFGFGRRACPGEVFAKNSIFISVSRILWAFDALLPQKDLQETSFGQAQPTTAMSNVFKIDGIRLMPRSQKHQKIIENEFLAQDQDDHALLNDIGHSVTLS